MSVRVLISGQKNIKCKELNMKNKAINTKPIIIDEKKAHVEIKRYTEKIGQCQ